MGTDLGSQMRELIERGARPVSFHEVSQRHAPAARRAPVRRRTLITLTASGVAAAGCAAGLAIAFASPGAHAPSVAQPSSGTRTTAPVTSSSPATSASKASAFLTAETVKHMAVASRAALANSGIEQIKYRCVKNGTVTSAGTDTVTYSGSDWNYAVSTTVPAYPYGASRAVDGQYYIQAQPGIPWTHMAGQDTTPHFPRATTLLKLLSPAAHFQNEGTEVIGGVSLTHLHATEVSGLPADPTLARYASLVAAMKSATVPPGTLTGLDLWTDGSGVVHQMKILLNGDDGQATVTVTFTDIGQPQTIKVPPTFKPAS